MSAISIYLVRHGEAAASWGESSDPGLSELGWQQAEDAAPGHPSDHDGSHQRDQQ